MRVILAAISSTAVAIAGLVSVLVSEQANAEYSIKDIGAARQRVAG